jgi:hypothetical protein
MTDVPTPIWNGSDVPQGSLMDELVNLLGSKAVTAQLWSRVKCYRAICNMQHLPPEVTEADVINISDAADRLAALALEIDATYGEVKPYA